MKHTRRARQSGSALLIVFVFAAMVAIMLYRAMPVAAFEAERRKEELLVDRGNEYKRAVKLYVRKFQTFPGSMEALENTNRMRFLRGRYVDPFSGKPDWRILHAGPGGIIIDSKLKQNQLGANSPLSSNPTGAASTTPSFDAQAAALNGGRQAGIVPGNTDPNNSGAVTADMPIPASAQAQAAQGADPQTPTPAAPTNGAVPYPGYPGPPVQLVPGQTAMPTASDPQSMMRALLNNQNPTSPVQTLPTAGATAPNPANVNGPPTGATATGTMNNTLAAGGGIAGVASKGSGHTIKLIKEQSDRSLWEFVYDMREEAAANLPGGAKGVNGAQPVTGANPPFATQGGTNQNNNLGTGFASPSSTPAPVPPANQ